MGRYGCRVRRLSLTQVVERRPLSSLPIPSHGDCWTPIFQVPESSALPFREAEAPGASYSRWGVIAPAVLDGVADDEHNYLVPPSRYRGRVFSGTYYLSMSIRICCNDNIILP